MKFISTSELAKKWGVSQRRVSVLCLQGRIPYAQKTGKTWIVPENSVKPRDSRNVEYQIKEEMSMFASEQSVSLNINPYLLSQASNLFSKEGKCISEEISAFLEQYVKTKSVFRIGVGKDIINCIDDINIYDKEVEEMFGEL